MFFVPFTSCFLKKEFIITLFKLLVQEKQSLMESVFPPR